MASSVVEQEKGQSRSAALSGHIPSLDGIRGISFLLVFVAHAWIPALGVLGVSVFFFLSGFLITTLLRQENGKVGRISLRRFYTRRVLRIFPPFYITIAFIVVMVAVGIERARLSWGPILASLGFYVNYWNMHFKTGIPGFGPFWSLAVEEHFYLFFPLLFVAMNSLRLSCRKQALVLVVLCGIVLGWRLYRRLGLHVSNYERIVTATDTRIDMILFGCIMALAANPILDKDVSANKWLTVLGGVGLIASLAIRSDMFRYTIRFSVQGPCFIALFIAAIDWHQHWAFRWLNYKWLAFLGTLSYSLYLIHLAFLDTARMHMHSNNIAAALSLSLSIVYAYLMYRFVDRPCAALRKRFA